ncbi:ATP-dependent bile acid permease [Auricularia subglabra TFB-10046 SS5]|nr:ATP-dependent bile acid permease [Auricularia subglabra TFB-10046 SS5]
MGLWARLYHPTPRPAGFGAGKTLPEPTTSWLQMLTLGWVTPLLIVGFTRPLQKDDLWEIDDGKKITHIADGVRERYDARAAKAPSAPATSSVPSEASRDVDIEKQPEPAPPAPAPTEQAAEAAQKQNKAALISALHAAFWRWIWLSGGLKLIADALTVTSPLVTNALLKFLGEAFLHAKAPEVRKRCAETSFLTTPQLLPNAPSAGKGFGLAIGLAAMQLVAAICENHYQQRIMGVGMLMRSTLISLIFRKSLRLSGKARLDHSKGQITTMMSEDAPRFETAVFTLHHLWIAPIQLLVGIALLINLLRVSALVGLGVVVISFPIQAVLLVVMFSAIQRNIRTTDERVRLLQEVLVGIRSVKMYAWETYFAHRIGSLRDKELTMIRRFSLVLSWLIAVTSMTPIAAATLSFITYSLLKHTLDPATVFSALQLFNIIRLPLLLLPIASSSLTQALVSLDRVAKFLSAEEAPAPFPIDASESSPAVAIDRADFQWEADPEEAAARERKRKEEEGKQKSMSEVMAERKAAAEKKARQKQRERRARKGLPPLPELEDAPEEKEEKTGLEKEPFKLRDITMRVPKGAFVALVGRVGSGKSSLLQALAGEMRKTAGDVVLGGTLAYAQQAPWIVNATLRDNIIFGEPVDEARYQKVLRACSLLPDLETLARGDRTEIGEKGINLSGGQKARVCLARAAYARSDILLLDDPLSAVDAHVGHALVDECFEGAMKGRTRVLVTHQLHVLPRVDRIFVMDHGRIAEEGTYQELLALGGEFARLIDEFGTEKQERRAHTRRKTVVEDDVTDGAPDEALMQEEDRVLGQVQFSTYKKYFRAAGGVAWMPWLLACLTLGQVLQVADNLFLGFWTGQTIRGFGNAEYIAIYASLGAGEAIVAFITAFSFALAAIRASRVLFAAALSHVMRSPVSFFDTTPMGRVVSRLTKDVNTLDQGLSFIFYSLFVGIFSVFGTIGLVFYTFPYLGILFAPLGLAYTAFFLFYRRNSVEVKRLDSLLRSALYSSYIEALAGIAAVRATRQEDRFIQRTETAIDQQNRAAYMNISIARWLNLRLNVFSSALILGIGLFAVGERETINPAKVGVVLTYSLSVMAMLADLVSQFATMEQNLNAVERMIHFGELPTEGATGGKDAPPSDWPAEGNVRFKGVTLAYRDGLPDVLREVSFEIHGGEKIGVCGRTGAGKSSLVQVLLRMFEAKSGTIEIDGVDIRTLDLEQLRARLSVIPQDSLFLGTLRDTIDPMQTRTDAELLEILQQAHLLPGPGQSDPAAEAKFTLDASVGHDGVSLSAGEKQQLALCRVLITRSNIIILDEATSSVDVETDAKLQQTIKTQLADSTLLCIAHRLNTIVGYDRILVMDQGRVAEFDSPLNLYDNPYSIFHSLCEQASIGRDDIIRLRADFAGTT